MVVDERGMQVDGVRHDRGAQHGRGHEHGISAFEAWNQAGDDFFRIWRGDEQAGDETERNHQQQADDQFFENAMRDAFFKNQQHRRHRADDAAADEQRQAEQQFQRDRAADHFRQIGGDGDYLSLHEEHETARVAKPFAQDFRQAFAGDDAEFRGLVLDEHAHAVSQHQHPHQQVAVARARRDVRRHVARIHVCDRRHERGAEDAGERVAVVVGRLCALGRLGVVVRGLLGSCRPCVRALRGPHVRALRTHSAVFFVLCIRLHIQIVLHIRATL